MSGINSCEKRQSAIHLIISGRVTSTIDKLTANRSIEMESFVDGSFVELSVAILALEFFIKSASTKNERVVPIYDIIIKTENKMMFVDGNQTLITVKIENIIISSDILIKIVRGTNDINVMFFNDTKKYIPYINWITDITVADFGWYDIING